MANKIVLQIAVHSDLSRPIRSLERCADARTHSKEEAHTGHVTDFADSLATTFVSPASRNDDVCWSARIPLEFFTGFAQFQLNVRKSLSN